MFFCLSLHKYFFKMKKILPILAMFAMAACTPYSIYVSTGGDDSGYGLDHWTSDEVLESYGLSPVGLDKTGPRETSGKFRNFAK